MTVCITKNGQSTVTANIPFAGFRLTNIGAPTTASDALREGSPIGAVSASTGAFTTLSGTAGTHTGITGFGLRDTSAAFDVTLAAVSSAALTAGRTLTLDMGNVAHTLAFGTTANTITFPNAPSGTVPLLNLAQTFTAAQTFTSASPQLTLGVLNTTSGGILSYGSTSGSQTWKPPAAAGAGVTITFPATSVTLNAAGDLTGTTLAAGVTASSFTSVGTLTGLTTSGQIVTTIATATSVLYQHQTNTSGLIWGLDIANTATSGTSSSAGIKLGNNSDPDGRGQLQLTTQYYTPTGMFVADGLHLLTYGAGGVSIGSLHASGTTKIYAGGATLAATFTGANTALAGTLGVTGAITATNLAGIGTRTVVVDANGVLSAP